MRRVFLCVTFAFILLSLVLSRPQSAQAASFSQTIRDPYSVLGPPTVSAAFMNQVLAAAHSPAAGKGQALYSDGVRYGIDPVFALAFFLHESSFGTTGVARFSLSLGNFKCKFRVIKSIRLANEQRHLQTLQGEKKVPNFSSS